MYMFVCMLVLMFDVMLIYVFIRIRGGFEHLSPILDPSAERRDCPLRTQIECLFVFPRNTELQYFFQSFDVGLGGSGGGLY